MTSKVLAVLAGLSLLLAIATMWLLVRSFSYYDAVYYSNLERTHQLFTVPGSVVLSTWTHLPSEGFVWSGESGEIGKVKYQLYRDGYLRYVTAWDNPPGMTAGFWFARGTYDQAASTTQAAHTRRDLNVALPIWVLTLLLLIGPGVWGWKLRQRYLRARAGHCIYCDTPMPTPDQCPNCGHEYEEWVL